MISPSSNVLSPFPSFIGQIITSLQSRSEVTIEWWGGKIDTGASWNSCVEVFPSAFLGSQGPFVLGNALISIDYKGVLTRAYCMGTPIALWLEWVCKKETFPVHLSESITGIGHFRGSNAGNSLLEAQSLQHLKKVKSC
ncbi:hypothetical protein O181_109912 [Austropuccinia psidii MF-1]|uniref:Uncharacterized protein n=1 Tax=Austropuccinia psidii MF-1 TaxID=1389203 RepID=A0A9Q3JYR9_9BASI|nr:hypothetical protein [Austropuccinia psidii MF-1]